jgi:hypothetical protein
LTTPLSAPQFPNDRESIRDTRPHSLTSGRRAARTDGGSVPAGGSVLTRHLIGLVVYYAVLAGLTAVLWRVSPGARELIDPQWLGAEVSQVDSVMLRATEPAGAPARTVSGVPPALLPALAMVGSLLLTIPVAWVYVLTRRRKGFRQSLVHTLIILPIAVAGMLVLVQHSITLAFSLAGIVALVRFRNTLDDTKDAVYIFVATGIGIAAAVEALAVGAAMSILFNIVVIILWALDVGRVPVGVEVPTPRPRAVFSEALLRVHTSSPGQAQKSIEALLDEQSDGWTLRRVESAGDGRSMLDYEVKLNKHTTREVLLRRILTRGRPHVVGVELV